jgi:4-diphosphocytidyl-2-C-methyl-D-erythritol kinase
MGHQLTRRAHAKVNLALSVGPPLPAQAPRAGFHPIASWMACIELADDLFLSRLDDARPSTHAVVWAPDAPRPSPIDWPIDKDLAVRAHRLMERLAGRPLPVDLRVVKRTPVGGGLGGGSSDAAAAMLALRDLFDLALPHEALTRASTELGSDIAFFIDDTNPPRPALVTGLGDRIERLQPVPADILLVMPPFGCPTGRVYAAFDAAPGAELREHAVRALASDAARAGRLPHRRLFNDLAAPACHVEPRLARLLAALRSASPLEPRLADLLADRGCTSLLEFLVTGSGSTIIALGIDDALVASIRSLTARLEPGTAVLRTRLA